MQAIIMAAGKGSRLGELTNGNPKSFVELKGKKLIDYNLDLLRSIGVTQIIIVTGYKEEVFREYTKDMKDVKLVFNPFYELVNVIGSFYFGMQYLKDDFLYLHADTLCEKGIFEKMLSSNADIVLPVEYKRCDEEAMKVCSKNGKLVQITKKMPLDIAEGEFIGIAYIKKNVIPKLKSAVIEVLKEKRYMEYFESAIQKLVDKDDFNIQCIPTNDMFWAEIDFKEDYEDALKRMP